MLDYVPYNMRLFGVSVLVVACAVKTNFSAASRQVSGYKWYELHNFEIACSHSEHILPWFQEAQELGQGDSLDIRLAQQEATLQSQDEKINKLLKLSEELEKRVGQVDADNRLLKSELSEFRQANAALEDRVEYLEAITAKIGQQKTATSGVSFYFKTLFSYVPHTVPGH
jgi:septal ring factor EnvC (AmiA/AmiB activator)